MSLYYIRGPPARPKMSDTLRSQEGSGFLSASLPFTAGPWPSGLRHPIYNRGERVSARSGGPNPSGPAIYDILVSVKVEKDKFDNLLKKLIKAKPEPHKKIKTQGRQSKKTPIISPISN